MVTSVNLYGFDFNTQIGAIEQINNYENSWANFYANNRLNTIFELVNSQINIGSEINSKIYYILKNIKKLIPDTPPALLLHGDLWEGNILFNFKSFSGFIDPGSFYGHNEMEIAYLRWFNPKFIDNNFLEKYQERIYIDSDYMKYEFIYQLYYSLLNVYLWDRSYIDNVSELLKKLKL